MTIARGVSLGLLLALTGCATGTIEEVQPTPNVLLKPSPHSLALRFGPGVLEEGQLECGVANVGLERWRETLSRGFHASFDRFFAPAHGTSDFTLVIVKADPQLVPVVRACRGTVGYQAELVDHDGKLIDTFAGTAIATQEWMFLYNTPGTVMADAVGILYERIAQQLPRDL